MRRLLALALLMGLTVVVPSGASAQEQLPGGRFFDDNETVHEGNIEAIADLGITLGCVAEGTAYCPELAVTRAQMATFIARALDLSPRTNTYDDVDDDSPHAGNIAAIRQAGITLGCNTWGTLYCPNDTVSRAQMASFLVRALDIAPRSAGPFTDVSGTHADNINGIAAAGVTFGCNDGGTLFCPDDSVTRGQMASFLARGMGLEPVEMLPRVALTTQSTVCEGATPVCSGVSGSSTPSSFYIQEGWFYRLPYLGGDGDRFWDAEFRLFIDGVRVNNLVHVPATDLDGTMVMLEGYIVTNMSSGVHTLTGEWWWDDDVAFTSQLTVTISG